MTTYYEILGVPHDAKAQVISQTIESERQKMWALFDGYKGNFVLQTQCLWQLQLLSQAQFTLLDKSNRAIYDSQSLLPKNRTLELFEYAPASQKFPTQISRSMMLDQQEPIRKASNHSSGDSYQIINAGIAKDQIAKAIQLIRVYEAVMKKSGELALIGLPGLLILTPALFAYLNPRDTTLDKAHKLFEALDKQVAEFDKDKQVGVDITGIVDDIQRILPEEYRRCKKGEDEIDVPPITLGSSHSDQKDQSKAKSSVVNTSVMPLHKL